MSTFRYFKSLLWSCGVAALVVVHAPADAEQECEGEEFSSTFALIQRAIFENRGCASDICHGSARAGGLDLRAGASFENLIRVDAETVEGIQRVVPGRREVSLLFVNLAAKTFPDQYTAPLRAMPLDPVPALTPDELEAVRLWIEAGAPREGVVPGTDELLDACLPPPGPIQIDPLPPPPPGTGVQIRMPQWIIPPHSEHEVCIASYYDLTDQVPERFRGPNGDTFRFKKQELLQTPHSHHLIMNLYLGSASPTSRFWGTFKCRGGAKDGQVCVPTDVNFCGADSVCAAYGNSSFQQGFEIPQRGVACIGFGPGDGGTGINSNGIGGSQETAAVFEYDQNVYGELPLRGMIMWNSHAFNLTSGLVRMQGWVNYTFAAPEEQIYPVRGIFNASQIFKMNVPPFQREEVCHTQVLEENAHLFELSSHMHKRGKRFRIFEGLWRCDGGPNDGNPCSPYGPEEGAPDLCPQATCQSTRRVPSGDCDYNNEVNVSELITSVNIALGNSVIDACRDADANRDGRITINELIQSVNAALNGVPRRVPREGDESLLYVNFIYNDPVVKRFHPPLVLAGRGAPARDRTLTFCALYDNGYSDPREVKRASTSPPTPVQVPGLPFFGGPCEQPSHCAEGNIGAQCVGSTQQARDASCDSSPGAGDGFCDACPLRGGVTTEDEMFIAIGQYYVR